MKKKVLLTVFVLSIIFSYVPFASEVKAAEYPDKPIEFILGGGVGTAFDIFVRGTAHYLNAEGIVKPKITVFNKPGAGNAVAMNYVAGQAGNPYIIQAWTTGPIMTILRGGTKVKNVMDFPVISSLAEEPNMCAVHADSKYKSFKDLIEDARKRPDQVKMAIGNYGGSEHMIITRVMKATGVKFNVTAYAGSQPPYTSILGGHTDFTFTGPADLLESVKAGKLRILAFAGEKRAEAAPYAPTLKEAGYNVALVQLRGYWGPPGMPDYALKFWDQAFAKLSESKGFQDLIVKKMGMILNYKGMEELKTYMPEYVNRFQEDLKDLEQYGGMKK